MMAQIEDGLDLISQERARQKEDEGWSADHDQKHANGELIGAAVSYAVEALNKDREPFARFQIYVSREINLFVNSGDRGDRQIIRHEGWKDGWPWNTKWDKRKKHDKLKCLQIAGALIAAEIDRLQNL